MYTFHLVEDLSVHIYGANIDCGFGSRSAGPAVVTCAVPLFWIHPCAQESASNLSSSSYARIAASGLCAFSDGATLRCQSKPKLNLSLIGG